MATKKQEAKVNTTCSAYNEMAEDWQLIDDLNGGTKAMKKNCLKYLPKFSKEDQKHYNNRVEYSVLFGAYSDTVKSISSKPFCKPVTIQGELPEPLDKIEDDTDRQGMSLQQLAKDLLTDFVNRGKTHILVDYPLTVTEDGEKPNLKQERENGYKPSLVRISPDQLIGWRVEKDTTGKPELTQIRIKETQTEPDGNWGEQQVNYVRVIEKNNWYLYKKVNKVYELAQEGENSLGKVPLVTGYANQTGFMTAEPPLRELSEVNLAHYRADSDQRNILHYRPATLFVKGFTEDESNKIALGPNQLIAAENPEADAKFIEQTGVAIEAGVKDIEKLEDRMTLLGLQPFIRKLGNQTATGQGIDESRANSDIQAWVMGVEDMLYRAYQLAGEWINQELPDDFKVDIFNDFAIWMRAAEDIANLLKIKQAGEISRETFLREVKRRGLLSETVDIAEEKERIEAEGPALGLVGRDDK